MAAIPPRDVLNKETNARFWAQFHYKPGQKLSEDNPTDRAMMPVWMNVLHQVEREAKAGKLVLTYDRPEVQQALADAEVADQAAAMHLDAASKAPDAATAQQNVAAATTATQVSAQKAREAAVAQPPSISPDVANVAAAEAARTPPPPQAPPMEHIAHARTQQPSPSRQPFSPREIFIQETNARFWAQTGYKPGQKLDMSDPEDRRMAKRWMSIFRQVQHEAATGRFTPSAPPAPIPSAPPSAAPLPPSPAPPSPPEVPAGPPQVPAGPLVAPDTSVQPPLEEPKPFPIGKVLAIAAALAAVGGLAYMATRKSAPAAPRPRPRPRAPRVFVASPTRVSRATPARAVPRSPEHKLLPAGPSTSRSARG